MLLQFSVNNFRSIKDTITLSMNTASNKESKHGFQVRNYHLLNSAVVYGANASGKSSLLKAMSFMRHMVLNHAKITQSTDLLPHEPFRLNTETEQASSYFEIIFFLDDVKYRYGFEADSATVYAEWLYSDEHGKEARLFQRDKEEAIFYVNKQKFKEGVGLKAPDNQLFIWRCDQNNGALSSKILRWFTHLNLIDGLKRQGYIKGTLQQLENSETKSKLLELVKVADFGIDEIEIEAHEGPFGFDVELQTRHKKFNAENKLVDSVLFELDKDESHGTQKFFTLSAPILDTLKHGKVLLIDEFDASLHPKLTECFIKLFNDKKYNPHNAQLIFVTHDVHLLSVPELFELDQIWFTEKDSYGSTDLYSLLEFRRCNKGTDIRPTDNLEKRYLQGRFGAVPYVGDL